MSSKTSSISQICRSAKDEIASLKKESPLWLTILHATGIFVSITFVVFFIVNYEFIESQISDWIANKTFKGEYLATNTKREGIDFGNNIVSNESAFMIDSDGDGLADSYEDLIGTSSSKVDSDVDGYDDYRELNRGYDPVGDGKIQGTLEIPTLGISSSIIWSQNEEILSSDLSQGVVHVYNSAPFGMNGNAELVGIDQSLSALEHLKKGDEFILTLKFGNQRELKYIYKMRYSQSIEKGNPQISRDYDGQELTIIRYNNDASRKIFMVKSEIFSSARASKSNLIN